MTSTARPPVLRDTTHSLQRWCLKALHQSCDSMLYNALHARQGDRPLHYARHQGEPPLRFSCIAPHCPDWVVSHAETGYCDYLRRHQPVTRPAPSPIRQAEAA